ncbi:caspase, EACC1-associated type [Streptomyces pinistramenti]|uniref:caspase, EACC1-associated type n=1 Tax=Streptomyces pinistramenti TaxID=2884812 RepID=UPI001D0896B5|nr:AAA domain-containing protein [Streptomyces pinistramenti]MCB5911067.1 AAA domain-containing protein [Streptomyces pinistramenti]
MTRLHKRRALLIGNEHYDDGRFSPLASVRADVWGLAQVLEHRNIGNFVSVQRESDLTADDMRAVIGEFLQDRDEDELALVYVSGHGVRTVRDGGEFHFIAKDTDYDRVAATGVSAGFLNDSLEECVAPQKIVMIDCCRSGGFAMGLRTSDRRPDSSVAKSGEQPPLTSRGVYVLSSSRAGEDSFADTGDGDDVKPSAFTGEVIEALRTGKVSKDGGSEVQVSDLFHYVNRRMRAKDGGRQVPVHSALGVDDRIVIADSPFGRAPALEPLSPRPLPSAEEPPRPHAAKSAHTQPTWAGLLDYYRECVLAEGAETPLMEVGHQNTSYVCLDGAERFISGDVDDDGCTALPEEAASLVDAAAEEDAELWAGYPAVVLTGPRSGSPWRHPKFAPLLVRRVEIVQGEGKVRLKPYGPVQPHPQLALDWLGEEEATQLINTFQPSWHRGQHDRMALEARNLLTQEFELPCVQELRPDQLADRIDVRTPGHGARNTAVLFSARPQTGFTKRLLNDFADIAKRTDQIEKTALGALAPEASQRDRVLRHTEPEPKRLVTPLPSNEAQTAVLRSAMTRRLTVATGPPGTGKSQLVANLVTTAISAGQTVLVASTNNEAVDEVWRRCDTLVPGSIVRTGSARKNAKNNAENEAAALHRLRTGPEPSSTVATASMEATLAADRLTEVRRNLAHIAETELRLRRAGEARDHHAEQLGAAVAALQDLLGRLPRPRELEDKARRLSHARFLGSWRRARFLRRAGLDRYDGDSAAGCLALAGFAAAEKEWRDGHEHAASVDDTALSQALRDAENNVQDASRTLLATTVQAAAWAGRRRILDLLTAQEDGKRSDWPQMRRVLGRSNSATDAPAVAGWAVTSLSARRFPLGPALFDLVVIDEASQCAIPHVLPLLFRARRALVIGDPMQLTHITKTSPHHEALIRRGNGLRSDWLEKHRLAYRRHSAFHAAERAAGGTLLLDEHFRCHPHIAAISNDLFYDGGLTVLTDTRGRPALQRPAVIWTDVPGRATRPRLGGSWVNEDEIQKAQDSVKYLLDQLPPEATVGVVTPFAPQAEALRKRLQPYDEKRLRIGTVHTFQGGERDVMVFTLVAGDGMHPGAVQWVGGQLNLWNVAVTRARSHLIVVGNKELWRKRGGVAAALLETAERDGVPSRDSSEDVLHKRLYEALSREAGTTVTLGKTLHGHPVDALVEGVDTAPKAVLLDEGVEEGADAARHLRLMLHRRNLLSSGDGEVEATRWPAWRLYETDEQRG